MRYFSKTYGEARWHFKEAALDMSRKYTYAEYRQVRVPSRTDSDLTIDMFYLPAHTKPVRLAVFCAGVHGIEGMTGSAVELLCMREDVLTSCIDRETTGLLFIHGINPYGQKFNRRVTENNVDLGRNFLARADEFAALREKEANGLHVSLDSFLNPKKKYAKSIIGSLGFRIRSSALGTRYSHRRLLAEITRGQYSNPKGIFYGGAGYEPNVRIVEDIIKDFLPRYEKILAIDIHAGPGIHGRIHFHLPFAVSSARCAHLIETVYDGYRIEDGADCPEGTEGRTATGTLIEFIHRYAAGRCCIPMVLKFGTLDGTKARDRIAALHSTISENQCIQNGYVSEKDKKKIQAHYRKLYYPESERWHDAVTRKSREILPVILARFQGI